MDKIYERTELVIGKENLDKLKKSKVCICGIGGVGSYVLEAIARTGVGEITIIDNDIVDITNINRQLIATVENVGKAKVEEAKKRINHINPQVKVNSIKEFIDETNVNNYITTYYDYVIDAIDSVDSKIAIIRTCKQKGIKIISSMGMANRLEPLKIKIADISKTEICPLAKVVRKRLRQENINNVKVVFSTENAVKTETGKLGSMSYVPSVAGLIIASEVVKDLINNK